MDTNTPALNQEQQVSGEPWYFWLKSFWGILILSNALLGLLVFEWAWAKTYRFRNPNEELNKVLFMYSRTDAKYWAKWKFYPGAITILLPRVMLGMILGFLLTLIVSFMLIGHPRNEPLIPGCRKSIIRVAYRIVVFLQSTFAWWAWIQIHSDSDISYEEWLGNEHAKFTLEGEARVENPEVASQKPVSTIVCNHTGFMEVLALISSKLDPSFVPMAELQNIPLISSLCIGINSLFVERGSAESRNNTLQRIVERQKQIADDGKPYRPLCIFAEATTTNGEAILKFKRGAFSSMRPIIPCFVKFNRTLVSPTYDILPFMILSIFMMSSFSIQVCKLHILPPFVPNEYMLNKFQGKISQPENGSKAEPWEIYAWCIRDVIAKYAEIKVTDLPIKVKLQYEQFMCNEVDEVIVNGRRFIQEVENFDLKLKVKDLSRKNIGEPLLSSDQRQTIDSDKI